MAERNQKVLEHVRQELGKNPELGSRELHQSAQQVDKSAGQDSLQQFHARYVLPVKREQRSSGAATGGGRKGGRGRKGAESTMVEAGQRPGRARRSRASRATEGSERDRVRELLLQFAQELTDAESRSSLVQVLGRVDQYVGRIVGNGK
jgi:hypothetical protein